jgi:hypothetical protein
MLINYAEQQEKLIFCVYPERVVITALVYGMQIILIDVNWKMLQSRRQQIHLIIVHYLWTCTRFY